MLDIAMELHVFFYAVWTGCMVCGVYAVVRIARRLFKHSLLLISIEDIIFWIFASIYTYYHIFLSTFGVLRWYFFAGIVVGIWCAHIIWYVLEKNIIKIKKALVKYRKSP